MFTRLWIRQVTTVGLWAAAVFLFIGIVGAVPRTEILGAGLVGVCLAIRRVAKCSP